MNTAEALKRAEDYAGYAHNIWSEGTTPSENEAAACAAAISQAYSALAHAQIYVYAEVTS